MTLPERARALAEQLPDMVLAHIDLSGDIAHVALPDAEAAILAALEETRREAWEEALSRIFDPTARVLIRALIDGPRQGKTEL